MPRIATFLAILLVAGFASAQDTTFDPIAWGSNPALALTALAGFVAWFRQSRWGAGVDGAFRVALFTAAAGAVGGAALQIGGVLTYEPFAAYRTPLGGLAYGLALAFTAVTGVSILNYFGGKVRPLTLSVSTGEGPMLLSAGQVGGSNAIVDYIMELVRRAVGDVKLPAALVAVAPLLAQFAQSEAILTDDLRSDLQGKVLTALRKAGLVGVDL